MTDDNPPHDGAEPLPEPAPPAGGDRATLTAAVMATSSDGLNVVLPVGTEVLRQGRDDSGEWEVTHAVILRAHLPEAGLEPVPASEDGQ